MSQPFSHFLITRYNVPLEGWHNDKSGQPTRDATWYVHRYRLFTRYCIPSLINQSEKSFIWLVYCDRDTPRHVLDEISKNIALVPQLKVRLTTGYHDCLEDIDRMLAESGTPYVITSRLDNDDGIGKDFIKTIQEHFMPRDGVIINLLNGHGYNPLTRVATGLNLMRFNHFTSLIERTKPSGGHVSVRGFQHDNPPSHFKMEDIPVKDAWLKIFHDRNLKSSIFGYPKFHVSLSATYGVDKEYSKIDYYHTFMYSIWWLKDGCFRKLRSAFRQKRM